MSIVKTLMGRLLGGGSGAAPGGQAGSGTGSGVQGDWNQNDETALDFIRNRPGGYVIGTNRRFIMEFTFTLLYRNPAQPMSATIDTPRWVPIVGAMYEIDIDGVPYLAECRSTGGTATRERCVGTVNTELSAQSEFPFYLRNSAGNRSVLYAHFESSRVPDGEHTIKVTRIDPVYQKIGYAALDDILVMNTSIVAEEGITSGTCRCDQVNEDVLDEVRSGRRAVCNISFQQGDLDLVFVAPMQAIYLDAMLLFSADTILGRIDLIYGLNSYSANWQFAPAATAALDGREP